MLLLIGLLIGGQPASSDAQQRGSPRSSSLDKKPSQRATDRLDPLRDRTIKLGEKQWQLLDRTSERALQYLATTQGRDGSFDAPQLGQPGITSLCALAYLSRGIGTDDPNYGQRLHRGIDYVIKTQKPDGLFTLLLPGPRFQSEGPSHAALYNHAMAGYFLCEVYGMMQPDDNQRIGEAINKALSLSREYQIQHKGSQIDRGGWKYLRHSPHTSHDSDVLVTTWQLKFLASSPESVGKIRFG